jgi:hypothetical protein
MGYFISEILKELEPKVLSFHKTLLSFSHCNKRNMLKVFLYYLKTLLIFYFANFILLANINMFFSILDLKSRKNIIINMNMFIYKGEKSKMDPKLKITKKKTYIHFNSFCSSYLNPPYLYHNIIFFESNSH